MVTSAAIDQPIGALAVRSVSIPAPDADLVDLLPSREGFAWSRRGEGLIGWGQAARFRVAGADRFTAAQRWWRTVVRHAAVRDEVGCPGSGLVAFGSFGFADSTAAESTLVIPSVVVGRRGEHWWVTTVGTGGELPPLPPRVGRATRVYPPGELDLVDNPGARGRWTRAVGEAVARIRSAGADNPDWGDIESGDRGRLDKVVLARDVDVRTANPIDARWALHRLAERYSSCFTFAVDGLVGATPELLVRLDGRLATSRVLAGTIQRTGSRARDEARSGSLSRSSKDLEEHEYAVASVAQALRPHCSAINVPDAPFVLHLPNVMHLATDVTGVVSDDSTVLALAAALHPTAAVCGTPRTVAEQVIEELEGMDRGRYAGPVGWLSADGNGDFGIALRCGQLSGDDSRRIRLFAGCGIVADSVPADELAESNAKLLPMLDALADD